MKILFSTYPMAFHTPGGGEIQLLKYKEYLEKKGFIVDLFDLWNPKINDYDVFHFFSCISGSNHICNFVKRLGLPVVISSSLWLTQKNKHLYPIEEIRSQLLLADLIVTNSVSESIQLSTQLSIPIESFRHVYNGVDKFFTENISQDLFRNLYNINDSFILCVGNIEPRKNQLKLAEAVSKLNKKLVLIGHIRDYNYANLIFNKFKRNVLYIGAIPHSKMLVSAYRSCEIFCLPSILETPGLAALEAFASGAKVILTSEGSTYEYFGDHVFYVDPYSIDSFIVAIQKIEAQQYRSKKFNMSKFYWDNTVESLVDIYKNLNT